MRRLNLVKKFLKRQESTKKSFISVYMDDAQIFRNDYFLILDDKEINYKIVDERSCQLSTLDLRKRDLISQNIKNQEREVQRLLQS